MSYEVLFIAKGGVILDIPFWDHSSTLITLQLLYDCYIQLSTLEIPVDKTLHYNAHVPMWDKMDWESHARQCWHSDRCGETNSLTCLWWSKVMSWCQAWLSVMLSVHSMVTSCWSELLPSLHSGALIWLLCPTCLIACAWSSWCDQTNNMLMRNVYTSLQACVGGRAHQLVKVHVQL